MRSINLLPKKSFWALWFAPLMTGLIVIYIAAAVLVYYDTATLKQRVELASEEIELTEMSIAKLREQRVPDPRIAVFHQFQDAVSHLENSRTDWLPAVHVLTSNFPSGALLEQAVAEANAIALDVQFPTLQSVIDYVRVTRSSNLFQNIRIASITAQQLVSMEEVYADSLTKSTPQAVIPTDEPLEMENPMLKELGRIIMKEAESHSDLRVSDSLYEIFTPEEIDEAVSFIEQWGHAPQKVEVEPKTSSTTIQLEATYYSVALTYVLIQDEAQGSEAL